MFENRSYKVQICDRRCHHDMTTCRNEELESEELGTNLLYIYQGWYPVVDATPWRYISLTDYIKLRQQPLKYKYVPIPIGISPLYWRYLRIEPSALATLAKVGYGCTVVRYCLHLFQISVNNIGLSYLYARTKPNHVLCSTQYDTVTLHYSMLYNINDTTMHHAVLYIHHCCNKL